MKLGDLLKEHSARVIHGDLDTEIADLTDDSRLVSDGACFVGRLGTSADGQRFVSDAIRRGAQVIVSQSPPPEPPPLPGTPGTPGPPAPPAPPATVSDGPLHPEHTGPVTWVQLPTVDQRVCGALAERFFGEPSKKLRLIGITGTNGKTTTAFLVQHLLNEGGVRCGLIGSIWNDTGAGKVESQLTTPGAIEFSRLLSKMVAAGCEAAVAEVSSHALAQGRTDSLTFSSAVFTNITGDHLDYHHSLDEYADAKARLFENLESGVPAIVNAGDPCGRLMVRRSKAKVRWSRVDDDGGAGPSDVDYRASVLGLGADHSEVRMSGPWGSFTVRLPLVGRFNVCNALQASAVAWEMGLDARVIESGLRGAPGVPGRVQPVRVETGTPQPTVVVDYAHTHDALENVLGALRPLTRGRLTVVFGCGGDRDTTKRAKMGEVACRLADRVVVTSDNPRTEEPGRIIEQILEGVRGDAEVAVEQDRGLAIEKAIGEAGPGDTVLLAGKGHERYQIVGDRKLAFDDRVCAAGVLRRWIGGDHGDSSMGRQSLPIAP